MKNKHYTIMIIPERSSKVKKWILGEDTLKKVIGLSVFVLLVFGLTAFTSAVYVFKSQSFDSAQLKIQYLEGKLQILHNKLASSESTLNRLQNFEQKLRVLARVDQEDDRGGIGPLSEQEEELYRQTAYTHSTNSAELARANVDPRLDYGLRSMELTADRIERKASLQEQSLQHLYELLRDKRSLLSATPSLSPVRGWISSRFGFRRSPYTGLRQMHDGVDIAAPMGSTVVAPADGIVSRVANEAGYGKIVAIKHGYGVVTLFAHNSKVLVKVGQEIQRGQTIALVGSTGRSTGPHVHYEVRVNGVPVDPARYILD